MAWSAFGVSDFEGMIQSKNKAGAVIRRDYTATVISFGKGMDRHLLVNGIGMTELTPITKFIVHLPLAFHKETGVGAGDLLRHGNDLPLGHELEH